MKRPNCLLSRSLQALTAVVALLVSLGVAEAEEMPTNTPQTNQGNGYEAVNLHCGGRETPLPPMQTSELQTLELVLHFPGKQRDIPTECISRLLKISEQVKSGQKGKLTIRSRNSANASSEMDLAIASERLDRIKNFLRNDRLALRAMKLELKPSEGYEHPDATPGGTQLIEIYSSPVN